MPLVRPLARMSLGALAGASMAAAQVPATTTPARSFPDIAATAVGEARVTPDRGLVQLAVSTLAATAAAAASGNAATQTRIIDAVQGAGVPSAQIRTAGYTVYPEFVQSGSKAGKISGYRASNTVQVEVRRIEDVGRVIDAALGAGANTVNSFRLFSSDPDSARREAVQQAVAKARAEATAAAVAAGGSLGPLLTLTIVPSGVPQPFANVVVTSAMVGGTAVHTPVEAGESLITAVVQTRWQFVPGNR